MQLSFYRRLFSLLGGGRPCYETSVGRRRDILRVSNLHRRVVYNHWTGLVDWTGIKCGKVPFLYTTGVLKVAIYLFIITLQLVASML